MSAHSRKRAVSIRMSAADVAKVKRLAERLAVRDSDVIRFAVKSMLARLSPLYDPHVRGRSLVPVFVESGSDLFLHFDIDAVRLEGIINEDVQDDRKAANKDIQLLAMAGQQLNGSWRGNVPTTRIAGPLRLTTAAAPVDDDAPGHPEREGENSSWSLRDYLYNKYVYRNRNEA